MNKFKGDVILFNNLFNSREITLLLNGLFRLLNGGQNQEEIENLVEKVSKLTI